MQYKALTIQQPWAWAIAHGPKRVENRPRWTNYRGPFAIHAGKSEAWFASGLEFLLGQRLTVPADLPFGAVVAVAELVDCWYYDVAPHAQQEDPFAFGPCCYQLANVRPLITPIPWRGKQGWFTVEIPADLLG